jgi:hypothetical protein
MDFSKANAQALARLNKSIMKQNTAIQGGIVIGELAQTLRMIKNPALGLRKAADLLQAKARRIRTLWRRNRRGNSSSASIPGELNKARKALTENLADLWLEAQFGWKPLMSDINAGSEALQRYKSGQSLKTQRVTGTSRVEVSGTETTVEGTESFAHWKKVERIVGITNVIYRGAIRVEARDPATMDAALIGFNPESWLPTAWELIPYSFLIDYFTNIGDIVYGWSTITQRLAWCNRTVRREYKKTGDTWSDKSLHLPDITSVSIVPATYVCSKRHVSRAEYNGTLVPDLTFEIPDLGSKRWLNIAALIASRKADRHWSYD